MPLTNKDGAFDNGDRSHDLATVVETLCNLFYLIEVDEGTPESIRRLLPLASAAMSKLKDLVQDRQQ